MAKNVTDTGDRRIVPVSGDGENAAGGIVEPIVGTELKPCFMCRSWEKDDKKLIQHLTALGLEANPDGSFTTPIAKDLPGRVSLKIYPNKNGFCRLEGTVTEDRATCEKWEQVRYSSELASRLQK